MPQLDFSFFISQIVWLLVAFGLFFCISKFVILPRLDGIVNARKDIIDMNIEFANKASEKAKKILEDCDEKIAENKLKIEKEISNCVQNCRQEQERKILEFTKNLNVEVQQNALTLMDEFRKIKVQIEDNIQSSVILLLEKLYGVKVNKKDIEEKCKIDL